jgi:hypothetical protein
MIQGTCRLDNFDHCKPRTQVRPLYPSRGRSVPSIGFNERCSHPTMQSIPSPVHHMALVDKLNGAKQSICAYMVASCLNFERLEYLKIYILIYAHHFVDRPIALLARNLRPSVTCIFATPIHLVKKVVPSRNLIHSPKVSIKRGTTYVKKISSEENVRKTM